MLITTAEAITRFAMPAVGISATAFAAAVRPKTAYLVDAARNGATGGAHAWSPPV